jgi:hypothetical protein
MLCLVVFVVEVLLKAMEVKGGGSKGGDGVGGCVFMEKVSKDIGAIMSDEVEESVGRGFVFE